MMKALVAGLLAAAAVVVPAVAMAQDVSLREALRQRMETRGGPGGRERLSDGRAVEDRAALPDRDRGARAAARVEAQAASQGGWQRPDRGERPQRVDRSRGDVAVPANAGAWQRPDRPERSAAPAGGWDRRDRENAGATPQRAQRDPRDGRPLWTERNFRGDAAARRDRDANRDRRDRDWNRDRDQRADRDRNWNGNRFGWEQRGQGNRDAGWNDRGQWDRGNRRNQGGQWNREWRRNPRYDWNRYRSNNRSAYRLPRYYAPYGWDRGYQRFSVGVRLSSVLFAQDYWIDDPYSYRLPEVDGPYRWVRYYDDALLVDIYTGQVVDVVNGMFWQG